MSVRFTNPDPSKARPHVFAWRQRILIGYLNLLVGEEGVGKTLLACWLIAGWTRGDLPGALQDKPVNVGIVADEDAFEDTWTPRLVAAGADLTRVRQIHKPDYAAIDIAEDYDRISTGLRRYKLKVVFFDALLDNLGSGADGRNTKKVRDELRPVARLAREHKIAALGSMHPNKQAGSFRQLVFGAGFNTVSRSSLLLAKDPDDADLRVVLRGKGNHSKEPPALAFRIEAPVVRLNGKTWRVPLATDFTEVPTSVEDLLRSFGQRQAKPADYDETKKGEAMRAIAAALPRDGEWHNATEVIAATGLDAKSAQRGRVALGIEHRKQPGVPHPPTQWRWPGAERTASSTVFSVSSVFSEDDAQKTEKTERTRKDREDRGDGTKRTRTKRGGK